jgi:hypothetical protein
VNKQLVNLIGAAASVAIILLGVFVFALPQFSQANTTAASAKSVAAQNDTQQVVLDTLTAQAADMTELEDQVEELRAEIPEGRHLDDVLLLAVTAAARNGGQATTVTPATPEAFAPRTPEAPEGADAGTDAAAEATPAPDATTDTSAPAVDAAPAPDATPAADAAQQVAVTVVIGAPDVDAATRILDALRAGPRLVAVTQATVTTDPEKGATLTVTLLAFFRP